MTFLAPLLLWGLPLAALPIVIHLLNRQRYRLVEWGAMMFLLQATRERRGHTRLRHLLILATRTLAVAALIFLISRPLAGRWFGWFGGRAETVIVVLDRSASMSQQDLQSGQTKRSRAIEQIATALEQTAPPRQLLLVESSGSRPQPLGTPAALRELPDCAATDGGANVPAMLQQALDYIVANRSGRCDVWLCSDLQAADWSPDAGEWAMLRRGFSQLPTPVRFHLLVYPERPTRNRSARMLKLRRERGGVTDQLVMDIELRAEGSDSTSRAPLAIVVDGARSVIDVELTGDVVRLIDHVVPLDRQRTAGWGKIELPNDANPRDNVFFFAYGDAILHRAVVVSDEPGSVWPLSLAAAPPGISSVEARVVAPGEFAGHDWQHTSLVLWQAPLPGADQQQRLLEFVDDGGTVLFFPPLEAGGDSFLGVRWGPWKKLDAGSEQSVEQWVNDHGLLARGDAGDPLPVNRVRVQEYRLVEGPAQPLARLKGGDPLVAHLPTDRGAVYFCATLPQEPHSNLAHEGVVFFVLVQRALQLGSQRTLAAQFGEIGTVEPRGDAESWRSVDGWPEGAVSTQRRLVAGIYESGERLLARNRPATEDTTGTLDDDQLRQLFDGLDYRIVHEHLQQSRSLVSEVWRAFGFLLIAALIAEAALCLPDVRPLKRSTV